MLIIFCFINKMIISLFQNGLNALHLAAKDGHIAVVQELIKRGATVDAATKKGTYVLKLSFMSVVNWVLNELFK
jgi:ankyrin